MTAKRWAAGAGVAALCALVGVAVVDSFRAMGPAHDQAIARGRAQARRHVAAAAGLPHLYDLTLRRSTGEDVPMAAYRGQVLLIVNTASRCGFTPQYAALQELHARYAAAGLRVLAFPQNDFADQEPGADAEIRRFCSTTYGVTFDLFAKIRVTGENLSPLYAFLTDPRTNPASPGPITWNFEKFLIDRQGVVVGRFASAVAPTDAAVVGAVTAALGDGGAY